MPEPDRAADVAPWDELIASAARGVGLRLLFQPIVDLQRRTVAGYETLVRFDGVDGAGPDRWFAEAAQRGRQSELDTAVVIAALEMRRSLPPNTFLTINVEPESLRPGPVLRALCRQPLGGVVIEVTEHRAAHDVEHLPIAVERLRSAGALIAVDDAGAGYAGLQQILALRPQLLKVDRALVASVDRDEAKAAMLEMLGFFANRIDAWVLAEGIETRGEARRCLTMGIPLAQGWWFGRPEPAWARINPAAIAGLADLGAPNVRDGLRPYLTLTPSVREHEARQAVAAGAEAVLVVLDGGDRPLGLVDAGGAISGELLLPLRANVTTSARELAHRLATSEHDLNLPVLVTDNAGRYVGTVSTARLLDVLAGS